jgi:hypothetical protein
MYRIEQMFELLERWYGRSVGNRVDRSNVEPGDWM